MEIIEGEKCLLSEVIHMIKIILAASGTKCYIRGTFSTLKHMKRNSTDLIIWPIN